MIIFKRAWPIRSAVAINPDNVVWIEPDMKLQDSTLIMFLNGPTMTVEGTFEETMKKISEAK